MKRIGIVQIWQESNDFNPQLTILADFERYGLVEGSEVLEKFGEVDELGGFIRGLGQYVKGAEPVGLLRAVAWPGGPLSKETLQWFSREVRENLRKAGSLDGLLFSLHGALVAEDDKDADGCLLEAARDTLGSEVPIVASLDCHGLLTRRMMRYANALVAYHEYPHTDRFDTGLRAAYVMGRIIDGAKPVYGSVKLPMITIAEKQGSSGKVMSPVFELIRKLEGREEVLGVSVFMTQGWLDVPEHGWSVVVIVDGDGRLAEKLSNKLADMCWDRRLHMKEDFYSADDAVERALLCGGKPVVIADGPDSTNSGSTGDSTHLLRAMIDRRIGDGALTFMVDPEAVAHAKSAGPGSPFEFVVGGKRAPMFCRPLPVTGEVISLQPLRYVLTGHCGENLPINMELSAAVRVGNVTLLLVEYVGPGSSPLMYRCVGLEPKDFKIVIVKSPEGFRTEYEPFAADVILTDSPGCASPNLSGMPFTRIDRPLCPLDEIGDRHAVRWTSGGGL